MVPTIWSLELDPKPPPDGPKGATVSMDVVAQILSKKRRIRREHPLVVPNRRVGCASRSLPVTRDLRRPR